MNRVNQSRRLSVIVPVYQVAGYLPACLEALLHQTYQNLEVILVDDGSSDESGDICDSYAENDSRVRVLHKENGGVSSARNAGIEVATGYYMTFVDADDRIDTDAFSCIIQGMEQNDCDFGFMGMDGKGSWKRDFTIDQVRETKSLLLEIVRAEWRASACSRIYIRERTKGIRFDESLAMGEDMLYFWQAICKTSRVYINESVNYHIVWRSDSATMANYSLKQLGDVESSRRIWRDCLTLGRPDVEQAAFARHTNTLLARTMQLTAYDDGRYTERYREIVNEIKETQRILRHHSYKISLRNRILMYMILHLPHGMIQPVFHFLWEKVVIGKSQGGEQY